MRVALFLDRDGVVIENRAEYVRSHADVSFIPGALQALARLKETRFAIFMVTNQSAVGRGVISLNLALEIHASVVAKIVNAGGRIDDTFICPHAPWENCFCRKPRPGLLMQAASKHAVDLGRSYMIGDALSDILAAKTAGVGNSGLVLTGRGEDQLALPEAHALEPFDVYQDLSGFVDHLLSEP